MYLNKQEETVYKLLLQEDKLKLNEISKLLSIPQNKCLQICENLVKKKAILIEQNIAYPQNPELVLQQLKEAHSDSIKNIANFEAELNKYVGFLKSDNLSSKVKFYRGTESITKIYEEAIHSEVWRGMVNIDHVYNNFTDYYHMIGSALQKKKLDSREIILNTKIGKEYKKNYENDILKIKLLSKKEILDVDTIILQNKVYFITFEQNETIVISIENEKIAKTQLMLYNNLWNKLT